MTLRARPGDTGFKVGAFYLAVYGYAATYNTSGVCVYVCVCVCVCLLVYVHVCVALTAQPRTDEALHFLLFESYSLFR